MTDKEKLSELLNPWLAHLSLCAANDIIAKGVTIPVRCKDCKKGHPELAPNGGVWCAVWNHVFQDDEFCSKGERKDK